MEGSTPIEKRDGSRSRLEVTVVPTLAFVEYAGSNVEEPPFNIEDWAIAPEFSTRLSSCINIRAMNAAGHGWEVVPKLKYDRKISRSRKELTDEERKAIDQLQDEIDAEREIVEEFLESCNRKKSFTKILVTVVADREDVGNGYMSVFRALASTQGQVAGRPKTLDRVVGHTVRIKKEGGYVARNPQGQYVHYKEFGDERLIDSRDGKEHDKRKGPLEPKYHARELIHFLIEGFRVTSYGIPRHLSTGPAIAGNRFASERNAAFFENDATPRLAIVVQGPYRLSKDSRDDIKAFLDRKGKGQGNQGRVMIVQAGKREGTMTEKEDVKIDFHKLTVGVSEEAGYLKYQDRNDNEIAEAFGIHPVFFSKDATRASMNVGRSITLDQTFEPDIKDLEFTLNKTIIPALGVDKVMLRLNRPRTVDTEGKAALFKKLERTGGVTPNDVREFLGKPRYRQSWADMPLMLAMQQLKVPADRAEGSSLITDLMKMHDMIEEALDDRAELEDDIEL